MIQMKDVKNYRIKKIRSVTKKKWKKIVEYVECIYIRASAFVVRMVVGTMWPPIL
jgi:hypothetical protein